MSDQGTATVLPPLYARWMDQLLTAPIPAEPLATCQDCVMCSKPGRPMAPGVQLYHPSMKCCSYLPKLPNFLVGAIVDEESTAIDEGRQSVEARIDAGIAVTPLGMGHTPVFRLVYEKGGNEIFGRATSLRCPHYIDRDGGLCGIWQYRNSVCTTWFCQVDRGPIGREFWTQMRGLLDAVERALATWCVQELDVGSDALRQLFPVGVDSAPAEITAAAVDGRADPVLQRSLWGSWYGREREFYQHAARLVRELTWEDVLRLGGTKVAVRARLVRDAYARLTSRALPDYLELGQTWVVDLKNGLSRFMVLGQQDVLELPTALAAALYHFDGKTRTSEAIFSIVIATRTGLPVAMVQRLVDYGILVPSSVPTGAAPSSSLSFGVGVGNATRQLPVLGVATGPAS